MAPSLAGAVTAEDEVANAIDTSARGPASVTQDGTTVQQHSLADQILADRYLASRRAKTSRRLGIRTFKIKPAGPT